MTTTETRFLTRPEGRLAYDDRGHGPLLVLSPGMGDLRSTYRLLVPLLVDAGYRVVTADLRGHGDSDPGFTAYGDAETADDLGALIRELGEPAVVIGNSMSAGAAVILAAAHPELVRGLVLTGPFVRQPAGGALQRALFRLLMARPWVTAVWNGYLPTLYAGAKPADFAAYRAAVAAAMRRPGYAAAFSRTTRLDHTPAEHALPGVSAPTLVVMGERDPDFPDPAAEAAWVAAALHGTVEMVPEAGHYPHAQQPEATAAAVLAFLARTAERA
jgi:pimeloyl-ACP methyl ester carboxylesterase